MAQGSRKREECPSHLSSVLPDEGESAFAGPECTVMPICQRQLFLAFVHLV